MTVFTPLSLAELSSLPPTQTTLITANNRLAMFMKKLLLQQRAADVKVISLPTIMPYKAWFQQLATTLNFQQVEMPIVLNEMAQQWYWRQALQTALKNSDEPLVNMTAAAVSLNQAHSLETEWGIEVREDEVNPEYTAFREWRQQYQQLLAALPAWDTPALATQLQQAIQEGKLKAPAHIVLLGFYSLSAYQQRLIEVCIANGSKVYQLVLHREKAQSIEVYRAEDSYQEMLSALMWAAQYIQRNPTHKVALVVPDLQQSAPQLRRLLTLMFKDTVLDQQWHIAVGRPLSEWGLVRSVLAWFRLLVRFQQGAVVLADVGDALLNAEFAFDSYYRERLAMWDCALRSGTSVKLSYNDFFDELSKIHPSHAQAFQTSMDTWSMKKRTCAEWVQVYQETLRSFSFPSGFSLNSINYQLCQAFEQAMKAFSVLDEMLPALGADEALSLFEQHLGQTMFQGQRPANVVLDIVGLYEIEGGQWDAVWVSGLTDNVLPQIPNPNPYLPIRSQRRAQVMHATPESEMAWAKQVFEAILHSAPIVVFSYPSLKGEEILRHSSFLSTYLATQKNLPIQHIKSAQDVVLEKIIDDCGLPMQGHVKGGYHTLEKQSINPLWAYAVLRLQLETLPDYPETELTSLVKGNFLHKVMELFYFTGCHQSKLQDKEWVTQQLHQALETASQTELSHLSSPTLRALTIERARDLVLQLIDYDAEKRLPFKIRETERHYMLEEEGLHFTFKVDRIDENEKGHLIFIDYKTGSLESASEYKKHWLDRERLKNLQLPLYASLLKIAPAANVDGVAFSSLSRQKDYYVGLWQNLYAHGQSEKVLINAEEWIEITDKWQSTLLLLFQEIARGEAKNRYLDVDDMRHCDVLPFLRLHETEEE